ncbi:MAG: hypothetical protein KTM48_02375, partial [Wolbachia endosymbiont of Pissodes strobi]|nr:hypothetical protein [Wolbachia endosymbiont of Pissodes strobi]
LNLENCGTTTEFRLIMNNAFYILNSHKISDFGIKQAACSKNIENIKSLFTQFSYYINNLKFSDGMLVLDSQRKSGICGFLMAIKALLGIYDELLKTNLNLFLHIN